MSYGKVCHGEGDNAILAHLRLCGTGVRFFRKCIIEKYHWENHTGRSERQGREGGSQNS